MNLDKFRVFALVAPLAAAGCAASAPPDYSPGYNYVSTGAGGSVLAPDSCLAEPADIPPPRKGHSSGPLTPELGPHLPPGCANAYNLQRMVEQERDLVQGRTMGQAHGVVTARAAQRYLYGEESAQGGANPEPVPQADMQSAPGG